MFYLTSQRTSNFCNNLTQPSKPCHLVNVKLGAQFIDKKLMIVY